jgi:hypothetical protein
MQVGRVTQATETSLQPISRQTLPDGTPAWAQAPSRRDRFVSGLRDGAMTGTMLTLVGAVPAAGISLVAGGGARLAGRALGREGLQTLGRRIMVGGLKGSAIAAGGLVIGGTLLGAAVASATHDPLRGAKAGAVGGALLAASPFAGLGHWKTALVAGAIGGAAGAVIGGASAL